jgi:hypothetical protein
MRTRRGRGAVVGVLAMTLASGAVALSSPGGARSEEVSARSVHDETMHRSATETAKKAAPPVVATALATPATPVAPTAPTTTPTTQAAAAPPTPELTTQAAVPAPVPPAVTPAADPAIATMVAQVEASGIDPGSNWSWSMGDPATHCAAMSGAGTGCTYGTGGQEFTIFAGSPNLALVAHELANAETQNDAVPTLMNEVAAAEDGTSWSPTDAVASCLVEQFMGFQDDAAGTWQCSSALGVEVAAHIHDGS